MVLTGIGAWKFGETFDDSVVLPYASATPLLIISVIGLVVIARKKPIEKASK